MLAGHSFGGITAVVSAARLPEHIKIKAVQVLDPWFYKYEEELRSGELKVGCPLQIINSEMFHPNVKLNGFDSWGTVKAVCKNSED